MLDFIGRINDRRGSVTIAMTLALLLALSSLLVPSGCGEKSVVEEGEEEPGVVVENGKGEESDGEEDGETVDLAWEYTNDMYGFSIYYPEDWESSDILEGHGCSIKDPTNDKLEVLAWAEPAQEKMPEEWLEEYYTMMSAAFDTERDPSTLTTGDIEGADYVYDYWTQYVPVGDYTRYYEVMVAEKDGNIFVVTAEYPVDEDEVLGPIMTAIMDSLVLPDGDAGG